MRADGEFDLCITRRGEALSVMDEGPTFGRLPMAYYYRGVAREEVGTANFADSYREYLKIRVRRAKTHLWANSASAEWCNDGAVPNPKIRKRSKVKSHFGGGEGRDRPRLELSQLQRLKQLEDENRRLKHIVAQQPLDIYALKAVVAKVGRPGREARGGEVAPRRAAHQRAARLSCGRPQHGDLALPTTRPDRQPRAPRAPACACRCAAAVRVSPTPCPDRPRRPRRESQTRAPGVSRGRVCRSAAVVCQRITRGPPPPSRALGAAADRKRVRRELQRQVLRRVLERALVSQHRRRAVAAILSDACARGLQSCPAAQPRLTPIGRRSARCSQCGRTHVTRVSRFR